MANGMDGQRIFNALMRQSLSAFTQKAFNTVSPSDKYLHNWHIDAMSEALMACYHREIKRLVINIPPRYMKSISGTVAFPCWGIGRDPALQFMCVSYSERLSNKHSVDSRLIINQPWYRAAFPEVILASDQNEKHKFQTTRRGHRIATSMQGVATGEGCNFLIVDDPHNVKKALSDAMRESDIGSFDQTFTSRLNDKKRDVIIIIMQRLHEADLAGHVLKQGGYEHLCLPAECEKRTIIQIGNFKKTREVGEYLHPDREGKKEIEQRKRELGSYGYSGQYQQSPTPVGGGMVKRQWIPRFQHRMERYTRIIHSWDTSYKPQEINDPSVLTVWGEHDRGYDLLYVYRDRIDYPTLKRQAKNFIGAWKPDAVLIEDKASGQSLIQELREDREVRTAIVAIEPEGDKLTRLATEAAKFEAGMVRIPEQADWLPDYENEIFKFPVAATKDQVDSTSQFLRWAGENGPVRYEFESLDDTDTHSGAF